MHTRPHCSYGSSVVSRSTPHGYAMRLETFAAHLLPARPLPYHERDEGVDSCGFARSATGSQALRVAAVRRVLHRRATLLVRPPACDGDEVGDDVEGNAEV